MFASFPKRYYKRDEALVTSLSVLLASGIAEKRFVEETKKL